MNDQPFLRIGNRLFLKGLVWYVIFEPKAEHPLTKEVQPFALVILSNDKQLEFWGNEADQVWLYWLDLSESA